MVRSAWFRVTTASLSLATLACHDNASTTAPGADLPSGGTVAPLFVASVPIPPAYGIHDTFIRDGIAFVCAWNTGVMIYDVGNGIAGGSPASPKLIATYATASGAVNTPSVHNAWWFWDPSGGKKYLFIGQEGPGSIGTSSTGDIHVVDVADLAHPAEAASFHMNGAGTHNFWMDENAQILYAAYYNGGIVALDVSGTLSGDLSSRVIGTIQFGAGDTYTWGVQLYNGSLYAIDMVSGLWQIPLNAGRFATPRGGNNVPERYSSDLGVSGGYAYTGTWGALPRQQGVAGNVVKIWHLDQTGAPTLVDSIIAPQVTTISDVKVSPDGKLLMFSTEYGPNGGFWFYSLRDPAHPAYVADYLAASGTNGIHTAKFATINGHLFAFGAQDPGTPALIILDVSALDN